MIKIGTQFRYTFADSNPTWTVVEKRGRGTWLAEINADDLDYGGRRGAFTTEQIESAVGWEKMIEKTMDDSESFFKNLSPGEIVHYNNGFNSYVRCEATKDHKLLPIALVGDWKSYDLPKRSKNGEIIYGYHVTQILNKETFQPHASNVWEYNVTKSKSAQPINFNQWHNPKRLTPISLKVPELTQSEQFMANKYQLLDRIRVAVNTNDTPEVIFERLKKMLESA